MTRARGNLITAIGLPCCGKSTIMRAAAELCGASCFIEPEEKDWPEPIHNSGALGHGIAITWFRATRVAALLAADKVRQSGANVFVDCYYDKLMAHYMASPAFDWLLSKNDPYYPILRELAELDLERLPDADCVVMMTLSSANWIERIRSRNRRFDCSANLHVAFKMQDLYLEAVDKYCSRKRIMSIMFDNDPQSVPAAAARLVGVLREAHLL